MTKGKAGRGAPPVVKRTLLVVLSFVLLFSVLFPVFLFGLSSRGGGEEKMERGLFGVPLYPGSEKREDLEAPIREELQEELERQGKEPFRDMGLEVYMVKEVSVEDVSLWYRGELSALEGYEDWTPSSLADRKGGLFVLTEPLLHEVMVAPAPYGESGALVVVFSP